MDKDRAMRLINACKAMACEIEELAQKAEDRDDPYEARRLDMEASEYQSDATELHDLHVMHGSPHASVDGENLTEGENPRARHLSDDDLSLIDKALREYASICDGLAEHHNDYQAQADRTKVMRGVLKRQGR